PPKRKRPIKEQAVAENPAVKTKPAIITVDSDDDIEILHENIKKKPNKRTNKAKSSDKAPQVHPPPSSSNAANNKKISKKGKVGDSEKETKVLRATSRSEKVVDQSSITVPPLDGTVTVRPAPAITHGDHKNQESSSNAAKKSKKGKVDEEPAKSKKALCTNSPSEKQAIDKSSVTGPSGDGTVVVPPAVIQDKLDAFQKVLNERPPLVQPLQAKKPKKEVKEEIMEAIRKEPIVTKKRSAKGAAEAKKVPPPAVPAESIPPSTNQVSLPPPTASTPAAAAAPTLAATSAPATRAARKKKAAVSQENDKSMEGDAPPDYTSVAAAIGKEIKEKGKKTRTIAPKRPLTVDTETNREQSGDGLCALLSVDPKLLKLMNRKESTSTTNEEVNEKEQEREKKEKEAEEKKAEEKVKDDAVMENTVEKEKTKKAMAEERRDTIDPTASAPPPSDQIVSPAAEVAPQSEVWGMIAAINSGVKPYVPPRFTSRKQKKIVMLQRVRQEDVAQQSAHNRGLAIEDKTSSEPVLFLFYVHKKHHNLESLDEYFRKYDGFISISIELRSREEYASGMIKWRHERDSRKFLDLGREHVINKHSLVVVKSVKEGKNPRHLMISNGEDERKKREREIEREKSRRDARYSDGRSSRSDDRRRSRSRSRERRRYESPDRKRRRSRSGERRRRRSRSRSVEIRRISRSRSRESRRRRSRSRSVGSRRRSRSRSNSRESRERRRKEKDERGKEKKEKEEKFISRAEMAKMNADQLPILSSKADKESAVQINKRGWDVSFGQHSRPISRPSIVLPSLLTTPSLFAPNSPRFNTPLPPPPPPPFAPHQVSQ
ncbi:hypothetical protein PFISCL1PPCAC_23447, partial [Pristionchus fissidentatus]